MDRRTIILGYGFLFLYYSRHITSEKVSVSTVSQRQSSTQLFDTTLLIASWARALLRLRCRVEELMEDEHGSRYIARSPAQKKQITRIRGGICGWWFVFFDVSRVGFCWCHTSTNAAVGCGGAGAVAVGVAGAVFGRKRSSSWEQLIVKTFSQLDVRGLAVQCSRACVFTFQMTLQGSVNFLAFPKCCLCFRLFLLQQSWSAASRCLALTFAAGSHGREDQRGRVAEHDGGHHCVVTGASLGGLGAHHGQRTIAQGEDGARVVRWERARARPSSAVKTHKTCKTPRNTQH